MQQTDLFGAPIGPAWPDGFRYQDGVVAPDEEAALLRRVAELPLKEFEFHGYVGRRRTVSYGWHYDFAARQLRTADDMPDFLLALRESAARFAGMEAARLQHVLVTEYGPGAAIGWHKDKDVFGEIVGVSLGAPCTFRLRRPKGAGWTRVNLVAEPRSAYLLSGEARTLWEHSIPPVDALRYSITYRNLRADA